MIHVFGWISAACFAVCAFPQALKSYREKHSNGVDHNFLLFWFIGEVAGIIYVTGLHSYPLLFNYTVNLAFLVVIIYYKVFPENADKALESFEEGNRDDPEI